MRQRREKRMGLHVRQKRQRRRQSERRGRDFWICVGEWLLLESSMAKTKQNIIKQAWNVQELEGQ